MIFPLKIYGYFRNNFYQLLLHSHEVDFSSKKIFHIQQTFGFNPHGMDFNHFSLRCMLDILIFYCCFSSVCVELLMMALAIFWIDKERNLKIISKNIDYKKFRYFFTRRNFTMLHLVDMFLNITMILLLKLTLPGPEQEIQYYIFGVSTYIFIIGGALHFISIIFLLTDKDPDLKMLDKFCNFFIRKINKIKCCGNYLLKKPIQEIYISDPKKKYTGDKCKEHFYGVRPSSIPLIDAVMMEEFGKPKKSESCKNHKNKVKKCKQNRRKSQFEEIPVHCKTNFKKGLPDQNLILAKPEPFWHLDNQMKRTYYQNMEDGKIHKDDNQLFNLQVGKLTETRSYFHFDDGRKRKNFTSSGKPKIRLELRKCQSQTNEFRDEKNNISDLNFIKTPTKNLTNTKTKNLIGIYNQRRNSIIIDPSYNKSGNNDLNNNTIFEDILGGSSEKRMFQVEACRRYMNMAHDEKNEKVDLAKDIFSSQDTVVIDQMLRVLNEGERNATEVIRDAILRK